MDLKRDNKRTLNPTKRYRQDLSGKETRMKRVEHVQKRTHFHAAASCVPVEDEL